MKIKNQEKLEIHLTHKKKIEEIFEAGAHYISVLLAVLIFYTAFAGTFAIIVQRAIFFMFIIPIIFIRYPLCKNSSKSYMPYLDIVLFLLSIVTFAWILIQYPRIYIRLRYADPIVAGDFIFGSLAIFFILEAMRRTMGWILVAIPCVFMAYVFAGPYLPGILLHPGTSYKLFIEQLYLTEEGMFSTIAGVTATYLFTFIAFGTILKESGIDKYYMDFCLAISGKSRGGPAKVAVISSALMGTITGTTTSNVATTGALTIPMMKKVGFSAEDAASIEAASSTGGAIMPPIMGAGVFIMAQITGISLKTIILSSVLPALIYFSSIYFFIEINSRKNKMEGLPQNQIPSLKKTIKKSIHLFMAPIILVILLFSNYTPFYASTISCILTILFSMFRKETRMGIKKIIYSLDQATQNILDIGAVSAGAGLIMGSLVLTGLIMKVTSILMVYSRGIPLVAMFFLAFIAYFIGMGMPVTLSYILVATLGAPAMAKLGIPLLPIHLAIFWFSQTSTLSPPVCMSAFVAARIAQTSSYMKVGFKALKLGMGLLLIPILFIFTPLLSNNVFYVLLVSIKAACLFFLIVVITEKFLFRALNFWQEIILIIVSFISLFLLFDNRPISLVFLILAFVPLLIIGFKQSKEIKENYINK